MAWLRIESNFASHRKVLAAGQHLGKGAVARVIGIWTIGACYAVAHLTDGLVPSLILEDTRYDKKPAEVIEALVAAGLLHAEGDGYRLHDFHEYNPSAADVKEKRRTDIARKRQFQKLSARNPNGIHADSEDFPRGKFARDHAASETFPDGKFARDHADGAKRRKISTGSESESDPKIKIKIKIKKEQCADAHRVLVKVAHTVLDDLNPDAESPPLSELSDRLKDRASAARIPWRYARQIEQALASALVQRQRRES